MNLKIKKILLPIACGATIIIPTTTLLTSCSNTVAPLTIKDYEAYTVKDWKTSDTMNYSALAKKAGIYSDKNKDTIDYGKTSSGATEPLDKAIQKYLVKYFDGTQSAKERQAMAAYIMLANGYVFANVASLIYGDTVKDLKAGGSIENLDYNDKNSMKGLIKYTPEMEEGSNLDIGNSSNNFSLYLVSLINTNFDLDNQTIYPDGSYTPKYNTSSGVLPIASSLNAFLFKSGDQPSDQLIANAALADVLLSENTDFLNKLNANLVDSTASEGQKNKLIPYGFEAFIKGCFPNITFNEKK